MFVVPAIASISFVWRRDIYLMSAVNTSRVSNNRIAVEEVAHVLQTLPFLVTPNQQSSTGTSGWDGRPFTRALINFVTTIASLLDFPT